MSIPVQIPDEEQKGLRRRIATGTRVESRRRSVCDKDGHRKWARGVVIGHDPSLDLPLVEWDDERGLSPEAIEDDEYELDSFVPGFRATRPEILCEVIDPTPFSEGRDRGRLRLRVRCIDDDDA